MTSNVEYEALVKSRLQYMDYVLQFYSWFGRTYKLTEEQKMVFGTLAFYFDSEFRELQLLLKEDRDIEGFEPIQVDDEKFEMNFNYFEKKYAPEQI